MWDIILYAFTGMILLVSVWNLIKKADEPMEIILVKDEEK